MSLSGRLVQWNDERGFGFIAGDDGTRYFVHISAIGRIATRPRIGDRVTFAPGIDRQGRQQARSVRIAGANPQPSREVLQRGVPTGSTGPEWRFAVAGLLGLCLLAGLLIGTISLEAGLAYVVVGAVSLALYYQDKQFAENRQWRISEAMLLGLDLCFGIIGGLLGQAIFRHKTRKPGYVATTMLLAGVHGLWLAGMAMGTIELGDLMALLGQ